MVPLIVLLIIERQMMGAFYLFVIAGLTDGLDGFLAKRFDWSSELGPGSIRLPTRLCWSVSM